MARTPAATRSNPTRNATRRYRTSVAMVELPSVFKEDVAADSDFTPLLNRFHATQSDEDRNALITHLLPMVMKAAYVRRRRSYLNQELDELVSDGCATLHSVINRYHGLCAQRFLQICSKAIRHGFARGMHELRGVPYVYNARQKITRSWHQRFVRENGRLPTRDERQAYLATVINNPAMEVRPPRKRHIAFSALDTEGMKGFAASIEDGHDSIAPAIDKDTIEFALKGFIGADREIFKMAVLDGLTSLEIAKQLGMNKHAMKDRVNAVLWQARCRCDLARALDVEPADRPALLSSGRYASVKKLPPARLAG